MAEYLYVFAVRSESPNLAQVEKTAGTRGTPPKKRSTGPHTPPRGSVRPVTSKFSHSPADPSVLFFLSDVIQADDPADIELGPLTPLLELCDDWVLLEL